MPRDRITTAEEFKETVLHWLNHKDELSRLKMSVYGDATGQIWGTIVWKGYPPCRPGKHIHPCGPYPDEMYCACGCAFDEACWDTPGLLPEDLLPMTPEQIAWVRAQRK
jgi:hypothetical protein